MDTQIIVWEMNLEPTYYSAILEGLFTAPSEPYILDRYKINWN